MFGKKSGAAKTEGPSEAAEYDRQADKHRAEIAKYRRGSDDPQADRYMIEQHETDLRTCEHNARVSRN